MSSATASTPPARRRSAVVAVVTASSPTHVKVPSPKTNAASSAGCSSNGSLYGPSLAPSACPAPGSSTSSMTCMPRCPESRDRSKKVGPVRIEVEELWSFIGQKRGRGGCGRPWTVARGRWWAWWRATAISSRRVVCGSCCRRSTGSGRSWSPTCCRSTKPSSPRTGTRQGQGHGVDGPHRAFSRHTAAALCAVGAQDVVVLAEDGEPCRRPLVLHPTLQPMPRRGPLQYEGGCLL